MEILCRPGHLSLSVFYTQLVVWLVVFSTVSDVVRLFRSQAARGKEGIKDGVSEMGTRLDPVPGLPGGVCVSIYRFFFCLFAFYHCGKMRH